MLWSASSENLRFTWVVPVPGCNAGEDDSGLSGGVGTRGRGSIGVNPGGLGGANALAGKSFIYRLGITVEREYE